MEIFAPVEFVTQRIIDEVPHYLAFKEVYSTGGAKFFVIVYQNGLNVASFEIVKRKGAKWTVVPPAPLWFLFNEEKLGLMIDANIGA